MRRLHGIIEAKVVISKASGFFNRTTAAEEDPRETQHFSHHANPIKQPRHSVPFANETHSNE
jgi:hypothetical protein